MKFSLILLLSIFSTFAHASVDPVDLLVLTTPASHTVTVRTTAGVNSPTKVQIVDNLGRVLHTANLDSGAYLNSRFQLEALPNGEYDVVLSDEMGRTVQPITVDRSGITVDPALAVRTYYPRVDLKEDVLTINYLNTNGKPVAIRLADRSGNELVSDRVDNAPTVQRAYNLENLPAGDYYVTVNAPNTPSYTTTLRLQ